MSRSASELSVSANARTYKGRPYTVLVLAGGLDAASRAHLRQAVIAAAREAAGLLVVDLSQLEHLDGQVLYELVRASHVTRHLGVGLALAASDPGRGLTLRWPVQQGQAAANRLPTVGAACE